jgi:hypothetical protein
VSHFHYHSVVVSPVVAKWCHQTTRHKSRSSRLDKRPALVFLLCPGCEQEALPVLSVLKCPEEALQVVSVRQCPCVGEDKCTMGASQSELEAWVDEGPPVTRFGRRRKMNRDDRSRRKWTRRRRSRRTKEENMGQGEGFGDEGVTEV